MYCILEIFDACIMILQYYTQPFRYLVFTPCTFEIWWRHIIISNTKFPLSLFQEVLKKYWPCMFSKYLLLSFPRVFKKINIYCFVLTGCQPCHYRVSCSNLTFVERDKIWRRSTTYDALWQPNSLSGNCYLTFYVTGDRQKTYKT